MFVPCTVSCLGRTIVGRRWRSVCVFLPCFLPTCIFSLFPAGLYLCSRRTITWTTQCDGLIYCSIVFRRCACLHEVSRCPQVKARIITTLNPFESIVFVAWWRLMASISALPVFFTCFPLRQQYFPPRFYFDSISKGFLSLRACQLHSRGVG